MYLRYTYTLLELEISLLQYNIPTVFYTLYTNIEHNGVIKSKRNFDIILRSIVNINVIL